MLGAIVATFFAALGIGMACSCLKNSVVPGPKQAEGICDGLVALFFLMLARTILGL